MTKREEFGRYLKSIRTSRRMSQLEVSRKLGYKSLGTLHNVEAGLTPLPIDKIHPLAKIYGLNLEDLLGRLRECEPELYARYEALARDIISEFTTRLMSFGRGDAAQVRYHHHPFAGGGVEGLHNATLSDRPYLIRRNVSRNQSHLTIVKKSEKLSTLHSKSRKHHQLKFRLFCVASTRRDKRILPPRDSAVAGSSCAV